MPTFGFAAFLKVASLGPKPQKSELRKRLIGSPGGGYDFHRSLKLASQRFMTGEAAMAELMESAARVSQAAERKSLIAGLTQLNRWRGSVSGQGLKVAPKTYVSPRGLFKIAAQPEFSVVDWTRNIAFHVWNTKRPDLDEDAVYASLALLPAMYEMEPSGPSDFGVLSLHEPRAYLLSERSAPRVDAQRLVDRIETRIMEILDEIGAPPPERPEDRPPL